MKTRASLVAVVAALGLIAGACTTPPGGGGSSTSTFRFSANKLTVVNHNDSMLYGERDEPFVLNFWFRVKINEPGSAQVGMSGSRGNAIVSMGDGETRALSGGQQASVDFPGVQLMDLADFFDPNRKLEVVGVWSWAMERDDVPVDQVGRDTMTILKDVLNRTLAAESLPDDPNFLVDLIVSNLGTALRLLAGGLFHSTPGIPDDAIGSQIYVAPATTGGLGSIVDATAANVEIPSIAIPVLSIPPDIGGGKIFSLGGNKTFTSQVFDQGQGRYLMDLGMVDVATLPKPPVAAFSPTVSSGQAPLPVSFDASGSKDPDGTIVAYNWSFGDFTTGAGVSTSHTFTTAGTFPVTLTVTDNSGMSSSVTHDINVGGAPAVAPTGLTRVSSGSVPAPPFGDFAWNMVPGATAYQVNLDGFFGGGCVSDHSATFQGQVSQGRVQAVGLCQGSKYDMSIRAQANGQWGPWSTPVRITL